MIRFSLIAICGFCRHPKNMRTSNFIAPMPSPSKFSIIYPFDLIWHSHATLQPCNICNDCRKCRQQLSVQQIVLIIVLSPLNLLHNWLTLSSLVIVNHVQGLHPQIHCCQWNLWKFCILVSGQETEKSFGWMPNWGFCGMVSKLFEHINWSLLQILRRHDTKLLSFLILLSDMGVHRILKLSYYYRYHIGLN